MKKLKKFGLCFVTTMLILLMLPSYVNAEGFIIQLDSNGAIQEYDPIIADTWEEVLARLPKVDAAIPEMQIEKDGYLFLGWYYDKTFTQQVTENEPTEHNMTLYAKWIADNTVIDMSKINLTVDDLIAGTEISVEYDSAGGFSRKSVPAPNIVLPNNAHFKVNGAIIQYVNLNENFEGIVEMGNDYYIDILIEADNGYSFSWQDDAKMLINGKETYADYSNNVFMDLSNIEVDEYGGVVVERSDNDAILRVRVKAKEKETILKGDMNNNGKIDLKDIILLIKKYLGII